MAIEEFVEGHEGFYDTLTVERPRRARLHQPLLTRTCSRRCAPAGSRRRSSPPTGWTRPATREVREMGRQVIAALGIGTAATHMEWFFGPKGLRFSEIGCRPPGCRAVGQLLRRQRVRPLPRMGAGGLPRRTDRPPSRRYACGIIALRPDRDGRIAGYEGTDEVFRTLRRPGGRQPLSRRLARRRSRWRRATWPTPGCGCAIPTTTCSGDPERDRRAGAGARALTKSPAYAARRSAA